MRVAAVDVVSGSARSSGRARRGIAGLSEKVHSAPRPPRVTGNGPIWAICVVSGPDAQASREPGAAKSFVDWKLHGPR